MSKSNSSFSIPRLIALAAALTASALLSSCGGGGGDDGPPTIRPKTLDDLAITLDRGPRLQFIRAASSPTANLAGEVETGTVIYTFASEDNFVNYLAIDGIGTNCFWPSDLINVTYEYTAINDNQATVRIFAEPGDEEDFFGDPNPSPIGGRPQSAWWIQDSQVPPQPTESTVFNLSFTGDGATITLNPTRVIIPESPLRTTIDNVEVIGDILTKDGDLVPENYNPMTSTDLPSDIAQPYLNGLTFNMTNTGLNDPTFDFDLTFAATVQRALGAKLNETDPDEEGTFTITVNLGTPIINAGTYTYRRITGTDDAILVLSGTTSTFDGTYTLNWLGIDNGDYTGEVDGGTPDVNEVIGTFLVPGADPFENPAPITVPGP